MFALPSGAAPAPKVMPGDLLGVPPPVQTVPGAPQPLKSAQRTLVSFRSLYGGAGSESAACAYLLHLDDFCVLLDCGWDDRFDVALLAPLADVARTVDAVVISHADLAHMGALPYARAHLGLGAPVYCTSAVAKMGRFFLYDAVLAWERAGTLEAVTLDNVDDAIYGCELVHYGERKRLFGKGDGIELMAHRAGHLVGGALWRITKHSEYAPAFNHASERHLNKTTLHTLARESLLIAHVDDEPADTLPPRSQREKRVLDLVMTALRRGGSVLMPCDSAGRVLELLLMLHEHWLQQRVQSYTLVLLSSISARTIDYAKTQLEWMSDRVQSAFEERSDNMFVMKRVRACNSLDEVEAISGPKVVLASMPSLDTGFARDLLTDWASEARNLVLFTDRSRPGSLARAFIDGTAPKKLELVMHQRVPITGTALEEWRTQRLEEKAEENRKRIEEELREQAAQQSAATDADAMSLSLLQKCSQYFLGKRRDVYVTKSMQPFPLYPVVQQPSTSREFDDWGQHLTQDFLDRCERIEAEGVEAMMDEVFSDDEDDGDAGNDGFGDGGGLDGRRRGRRRRRGGGDDDMDVGDGDGDGDGDDGDDDDWDDGIDPMVGEPVPTETASMEVSLMVRAQTAFVNMMGRADTRSLRKMMQLLVPRKLLLVGGGQGSSRVGELVDHFNTQLQGTTTAWAAPDGETLDVSPQTQGFRHVRLLDSVAGDADPEGDGVDDGDTMDDGQAATGAVDSGIAGAGEEARTAKLGPYELTRVVGRLTGDNVLVPDARLSRRANATEQPVFIGAPKLPDLRALLARHGFRVASHGGALVVNKGMAVIRKEPDSNVLRVEGVLSDEFFTVRDLVMAQFKVV